MDDPDFDVSRHFQKIKIRRPPDIIIEQISDLIARRIIKAGQKLPAERVLAERFDVSRGTVREALRALQTEGLIRRKRGSGTVIQPAAARGGALHQPLSNVQELMQYARDSHVDFQHLPDKALPRKLIEQLPEPVEGKWSHFLGLRISEGLGAPIALTDAYVHPDLREAVAHFDPAEDTLFRQLERWGHLRIAQVTQDIQAVSASGSIAASLKVGRRSPCLQILRCYYDTTGRLFEISVSIHPGERFAYAMHIEVEA